MTTNKQQFKTMGFLGDINNPDIPKLRTLKELLMKEGYPFSNPPQQIGYPPYNCILTSSKGEAIETLVYIVGNRPDKFLGEKIEYHDISAYITKHLSSPKFPNGAKFKVRDRREAQCIQEAFFTAGYQWKGHGKHMAMTDFKYFFADPDHMLLSRSDFEIIFEASNLPEFTINLTPSFTEVEKSKPKTIEINGKIYDKAAVEERLQNLPSISEVK